MSDIPTDVGHPTTNMLAVIKTGGKQYIVKPGDKIKVEKLDKKEGQEIVFSDVLLVEKNPPSPPPSHKASDGQGKASDGQSKKIEIGKPFVEGAKVEAKILKHGKREKIIVFKYKPKKRYSRKIGHRQPYTEIEITGIK